MKTLNPTDGFILHGYMVTDLHLEGAELVTFALIHQFSQSKAGLYIGGIPYLRAWTGWAENTCRAHLRALVQKGLIMEVRGEKNGVPYCHYALSNDTLQKLQGTLQNLKGYPSKIEGWGTPQNLKVENNIYKENNLDNNKKDNRAFARPSIQEVSSYCQQKGYAVDAEAFVAFYESKGWKVGNQPMKNWKAAVVTWAKRDTFKRDAKPSAKGDSVSRMLALGQQMGFIQKTDDNTISLPYND